MCGYYSRAATIRCAATIRINTVLSLIGKQGFAAREGPVGYLYLLPSKNKCTSSHPVVAFPFLPWNNAHATDAHDWKLYTDASGTDGYGAALWQRLWFHYAWQPYQCLSNTISTKRQDLFAMVVPPLTWGHRSKFTLITRL